MKFQTAYTGNYVPKSLTQPDAGPNDSRIAEA